MRGRIEGPEAPKRLLLRTLSRRDSRGCSLLEDTQHLYFRVSGKHLSFPSLPDLKGPWDQVGVALLLASERSWEVGRIARFRGGVAALCLPTRYRNCHLLTVI